MTTTINNITAEFETLKPAIKADFVEYMTRQVKKFAEIAAEDDEAWRQIRRGYDYRSSGWRSVRGFAKMDSNRPGAKPTGEVKVEWLDWNAHQYAEDQVAKFTSKLIRKLGDLTDVHIGHMDHGRFEFTVNGQLGERSVCVEQRIVFKVSNQGTPFVQWPARIYVDGTFTPEAKFKKLAA